MELKPTFNNVHNTMYHIKNGVKWDSRAAAVVCHVWCIHDNKPYVLLGKRGQVTDHPNKWNIPCGYLDWNENLQQAMFREIWEETGLDLQQYTHAGSMIYNNDFQPWYVYSEPTENRQNVAMHMSMIFQLSKEFILPVLSLDNMEKNESTGAYWMSIEEALALPANDWAFNHHKRLITFIDKMKNLAATVK